jgi:MOSC domain-containing protein YiiM
MTTPVVLSVSLSATHGPPKDTRECITLVAGIGVEGDVHGGATVRHRSRARTAPESPNLRQVHLIHSELHDELRAEGFDIAPGQMGENLTTTGVDLLALPRGARMRLGADAVIEVTGLRNPCKQLDGIVPGLMKATLDRDEAGGLVRKSGVMAIVLEGGDVRPGDAIAVELPAEPHAALEPV